MRAIRARYDPYEQTRGRVEQLKSLGHSVDKVSYDRLIFQPALHELNSGRVYCNGWDVHEHA
jgi:hypothetical protein